MINSSQVYFQQLLHVVPMLSFEVMDDIVASLFDAYERRRTIFLFGNGGSAALASHMACDLGKGTSAPRRSKRVRVVALTDNIPTITAYANDNGYENIFSEQLKNLAQSGDVAVAISCSGNSPNVIKALQVARALRMTTIGIGGFAGGNMKKLCDIPLIVPSENMQVIEDLHLSIAHCVFTVLLNRIAAPIPISTIAAATG
ncbi:MAG: D-sedoheptulose-7-phosphate isomerase [Terriglobales bacterium]